MAMSHGSGKKLSCTASHTGVTPRRSRRPVSASTPAMVPDAITPDEFDGECGIAMRG